MHWAELYSKDGQARYLAAHQKDLKPLVQYLVDGFGPDPTPESANRFLNQLVFELSTPAGQLKYGLAAEIDFLLGDLSKFDDVGLSDDERQQRRDIWLGYHVQFYNDLSIATHGESIFDLINRALGGTDTNAIAMTAMVMALQIDRTLLPLFLNHFWDQAMGADPNFWDAIAYRINNPPIRGRNKYPLLWILFKDLRSMRCFGRQLKNRDVLGLYNKGVGATSRFSIHDLLTIQRQRRRFIRLNPL